MAIIQIKIPKISTYKKDKRKPIRELYENFLKLKKSKWIAEVLYKQRVKIENREISFPILAFRTRKKGDALWIISGIHGEEPAGPIAISKNIKLLNRIAKDIPIVLLPLCNSSGYARNWRYPYQKKASKKKSNISVGDSEHLLIDLEYPKKPRKKDPSCNESSILSSYVLNNSKKYPPLLVLDFHEDMSSKGTYIYSQGVLGSEDPVAKEIVSILKKKKFRIYEKGNTIFNQEIKKGVVSDVKDGSIDELLSSKKIIVNNKIQIGPFAKSVVTIETNIIRVPLKTRIKTHSKIIKSSRNFFNIIKKRFKTDFEDLTMNYNLLFKNQIYAPIVYE